MAAAPEDQLAERLEELLAKGEPPGGWLARLPELENSLREEAAPILKVLDALSREGAAFRQRHRLSPEAFETIRLKLLREIRQERPNSPRESSP